MIVLDNLNIGSISGIVAVTGFLVEVVKKLFRNVAGIRKIPVWVFAVIISAALSFFANRVLRTPNGSPLLAGNVWQVMWSSIATAAGASGLYTWIRNPEPLSSSSSVISDKGDVIVSPKLLLIICLIGSLFFIGYAVPPPTTSGTGTITVTTQPSTATDVYNTVSAVAQGAEGVANVLAGAGVIPQIDVNLAVSALNVALTAWHNALNPPIGAVASQVEVTKAEAVVHQKIAALETLIANAKGQQAARLAK